MPRKLDKTGPDGIVAEIATRQHGVITTAQLESAGVHSSGISDRVTSGRLHRIHRGVYAVGHSALCNEGRWIAGVLACGEAAVLGHRSAAQLWGILPIDRAAPTERGRSAERAVNVTVPGGAGRARRSGIWLHRSQTVGSGDCTRRPRIPVTKPGRTFEDLRRVVSPRELVAARRQAEFLGLPLGDRLAPDRTRSELEAKFKPWFATTAFPSQR
jgi:hypothetical protein